MREILFRGKRIDNDEWVQSKSMMNFEGNVFLALAVDVDCRHDAAFTKIVEIKSDASCPIEKPFLIRVIPDTIGQYTGLTDKNGNKIFEGDIVKYTRKNWKEPLSDNNMQDLVSLYRIFYNEKYAAFWQEHIDYNTKRVVGSGLMRFSDDRADENIIEVIGNIYDNSELMKEENK